MRSILLLALCLGLSGCGSLGRAAGTTTRIITAPIRVLVDADPTVPCAIEHPLIITV